MSRSSTVVPSRPKKLRIWAATQGVSSPRLAILDPPDCSAHRAEGVVDVGWSAPRRAMTNDCRPPPGDEPVPVASRGAAPPTEGPCFQLVPDWIGEAGRSRLHGF